MYSNNNVSDTFVKLYLLCTRGQKAISFTFICRSSRNNNMTQILLEYNMTI